MIGSTITHFVVSIDMPNTLGSDLWETDEFTDVELVVDGERFRAHKMVLASQSAYFRGLLYGGMREALLKTITLPEDIITPVAFKKVLRYAYTRSLKVEESLDVSQYTDIIKGILCFCGLIRESVDSM